MYVFVTVSSGLIADVVFYEDPQIAVNALADFVKGMSVEKEDAAVFGEKGMFANAKQFLGENDRYIADDRLIKSLSAVSCEDRPIYIIGNPVHFLGFMVASPDEPMGYTDPAEAVSDLGQQRQDAGGHLKLYRVAPVKGPVVSQAEVEKHNAECEVEGFDYSLVKEYIT